MVVWEDRGVLKPPKPPTVHATGYSVLVDLPIVNIMQIPYSGYISRV